VVFALADLVGEDHVVVIVAEERPKAADAFTQRMNLAGGEVFEEFELVTEVFDAFAPIVETVAQVPGPAFFTAFEFAAGAAIGVLQPGGEGRPAAGGKGQMAKFVREVAEGAGGILEREVEVGLAFGGAVLDAEEAGGVLHLARGGIGKNALESFAGDEGIPETGEGFGGIAQAGVFALHDFDIGDMLEHAQKGTEALDVDPDLVDVLGPVGLFGMLNVVEGGVGVPPAQAHEAVAHAFPPAEGVEGLLHGLYGRVGFGAGIRSRHGRTASGRRFSKPPGGIFGK